MIDVEEAVRLVLADLTELGTEQIPFRESLGRVLAHPLKATADLPPFRKAVMDGFALRSADVADAPALLEVVGEARAGSAAGTSVGRGQAIAIMTGAPVPEGADSVQIVEETAPAGGRHVRVNRPVRPGDNLVAAGSEIRNGETILERGSIVSAADIAVMATFGHTSVPVVRRPRIALLATGDELVEPEETPGPCRIRNSNAPSLAAQLQNMGLTAEYLGIARDDRGELTRRIRLGLEADVLIITGGVSMGEYDLVKQVFDDLGLQVVFTRVAMKPGKPTVFAKRGGTLVFGLPGNPVSTFVAFENFVRPALNRMAGAGDCRLPRVRGRVSRRMSQTPGRASFLPARAAWTEDHWNIEPLRWKGSADVVGFSRANALLVFPGNLDVLAEGETVEAMLLPDFITRS